MFQAALRALGVELDFELARLKYQLELFRRRSIDDIKSYSGRAAFVVGLLTAAGALLLGVLFIGVIGLYHFLAERHGFYVALGVVAALLVLCAVVLVLVAQQHAERLSGPSEPLEPPTRAHDQPSLTKSGELNLGLARFVPDPGPDATALESVVHRVSIQGAEAAEKAIGQAEENVRSGSRAALVMTLALTALLGIYYGRSKRNALRL